MNAKLKKLYEVLPPYTTESLNNNNKTSIIQLNKIPESEQKFRIEVQSPVTQSSSLFDVKVTNIVKSLLPDNEKIDSVVYPNSLNNKKIFPFKNHRNYVSIYNILFLTCSFVLFHFIFYILLSISASKQDFSKSCKRYNLSYSEACKFSSECDLSKQLYCPPSIGLCNCPEQSSYIFCDCKPDFYWNQIECVKSKIYDDECKKDYECDQTINLNCSNGKCQCPQIGNWFWSMSNKKCVECPSNWILYSNHCYFVNTDKLTWHEAEKWCNEQGSNLMKIDDNDEYKLTYSFYKNYTNGGNLWIGGNAENIGDFRWSVDNSSFDTNSPWWCPGEPNNGGRPNVTSLVEGCVFMWTFRNQTCLNDFRCSALAISCCEKTF